MIYLAAGVFVVWLVGLYLLAGRSRDAIRLALQDPAPDALPSEFRCCGFRKLAGTINPERLNETGRGQLKRAIRAERIMLHWMIDGFIFVVLILLP
jgi:hypothetical protein